MPITLDFDNGSLTLSDETAHLIARASQRPTTTCTHGLPHRLLGKPVLCDQCQEARTQDANDRGR